MPPRRAPASTVTRLLAAFLILAGLSGGPAFALSEIQHEETPAGPSEISPRQPLPAPPGTTEVPPPQDIATPPADDAPPADAGPDEPGTDPAPPDDTLPPPVNDPAAPIPPVERDLMKLPEPVRRMHNLIVEACASGDPEKLRALIGTGESQTQITFGDLEGDPIAFLRTLSGDEQGSEILAIIDEVLSAGYVHLDAGTDEELYVWPYFFAIPLEKLDKPQRVELFKIITGGDYEEMKAYGGYTFYRIGITPQGEWAFFVAGN